MIRYLIGILLCAVVSLIYSASRRETWRETVKDAGVVFLYMMAAIFGLAIVVFIVSRYA